MSNPRDERDGPLGNPDVGNEPLTTGRTQGGHEASMSGPQGPQGEPGVNEKEAIHPWRWRALLAWVILFTIFTGYALRAARDNANHTKELTNRNHALIISTRRTTAKLSQLERTNCGLEIFLLTARKARYDAFQHEDGIKKQQDIQAFKGYEALAKQFVVGDGECKIPKKLLTLQDKKKGAF